MAVPTNRQLASAAERFVLAMWAIPGVIVVGDSTAGAAGNPAIRELPNGWTYQLPQAGTYTEAGASFEGVGIAPDVVVTRTPADSMAEVDPILERAVATLSQPSQSPSGHRSAR